MVERTERRAAALAERGRDIRGDVHAAVLVEEEDRISAHLDQPGDDSGAERFSSSSSSKLLVTINECWRS